MTHQRFFDAVLTELQSGQVKDGVTLLVGMLDTVGEDAAAMNAAREELKAHDLWQLLLQEPLCAYAASHPGQSRSLGDILCRDIRPCSISSTGVRLFGATTKLTFSRAFRERRRQASEILIRSWQSGRSIFIPGCADFSALSPLAGQDLSNIFVADSNEECLERLRDTLGPSINRVNEDALAFAKRSAENGQRFDLICAAELSDTLGSAELQNALSALSGTLSEGGKIVTASLLPGHLGSGWRYTCLGWAIHCHDEAHIARAALSAGLTARTYRDATDCVAWAEHKLSHAKVGEGKVHGY